MRRPTVADQLNPFEVFAGRELTPGKPLVARLLGRRFDQLIETMGFERPYDPRFGKTMVKTLSHLVSTLGCSFGFAERTDISLYAVAGGGDARRLLSRIAGEAAAKMSLLIGSVATFEARLYEFPDVDTALDYFGWRHEENEHTAIDRYCIHVLSQSGADGSAVARILDGLGPDDKVELLRQNALDFSTVPAWQRLGACVRLKPLDDPDAESGNNARLLVDLNLPDHEAFGDYLRRAIAP